MRWTVLMMPCSLRTDLGAELLHPGEPVVIGRNLNAQSPKIGVAN